MSAVGRMRRALTRAHLWVGEHLGLTRYDTCWNCSHCVELDPLDHSIVCCGLYLDEDGTLAFTDPCEAVWCDSMADGSPRVLDDEPEVTYSVAYLGKRDDMSYECWHEFKSPQEVDEWIGRMRESGFHSFTVYKTVTMEYVAAEVE